MLRGLIKGSHHPSVANKHSNLMTEQLQTDLGDASSDESVCAEPEFTLRFLYILYWVMV